jgi:hypothetical protein
MQLGEPDPLHPLPEDTLDQNRKPIAAIGSEPPGPSQVAQIQADGSLAHKQKYYHLHVPDTADDSGADGMRTDKDGRLYVATRMGIQFCDQAGRVNGIIPTPNGRVANFCFGGPTFDTLYAACGDKVYMRKLKVKGSNAFQAPTKPSRRTSRVRNHESRMTNHGKSRSPLAPAGGAFRP